MKPVRQIWVCSCGTANEMDEPQCIRCHRGHPGLTRVDSRHPLASNEWHCVSCRTANPPGGAYCIGCGAPMAGGVPSPIYTAPQLPVPDYRKTDTCAVLANIFGLVSLFALPLLFGAAGLALGAVAIHRIKDDPQVLKGSGLAASGIVLGALGVLWWVIQIEAATPPH